MNIYLGGDPDSSEALDFLGLAEGGEVIHYEGLKEMTKGVKNLQATDTVQSILEEEKKHLMNCIQQVRWMLLVPLNSSDICIARILHFFPFSTAEY